MPALKNIRHEKAVQAFLSNGGNKSAAYRAGYPSSLKWKDNVVAVRANELFKRGNVMVRLSELQKSIDEANKYSLERILNEFGEIAFANIVDIFDYDDKSDKLKLVGGASKLSDLPREITACISSLKQTKDGIEVKLYCRDNALSQIAKMKGHYAPIKTINAESTLADLLKND